MKRQDLINAIIDLPKEVFSDEEKLFYIRGLPRKFLKIPKDVRISYSMGDYFCYAFDHNETLAINSSSWDVLRIALEAQERKNQGWDK
jgi:hypothetical protein